MVQRTVRLQVFETNRILLINLADPSDDVLLEALTDYARQNLKPQQKLDHLKDDHNLIIKCGFQCLVNLN